MTHLGTRRFEGYQHETRHNIIIIKVMINQNIKKKITKESYDQSKL